MKKKLKTKYKEFKKYLKPLDNLAVAFSGGVDSTLLLYAAKEALGDKVLAITVNTAYIPDWELKEAIEFTKNHGIRHEIIHLGLGDEIKTNPENRCYLCKKKLFTDLIEHASQNGFEHLAEGSNMDDDFDYRPGTKALSELGVISPLKEFGLDKKTIRKISKKLDLPTFDKPAYACLLTRLPYNTPVRIEDLSRIEKAEIFLFKKGFKACRVRTHGKLARIEVSKDDIKPIIKVSESIVKHFRKIGFEHITIDLEGYRMGSFNEQILKK